MSRRLVVVPNNYTESVSRTANNILQQGKSTISKHSFRQSNPTQSLSSHTNKSSRSYKQHRKHEPPQYNDYLVENEHPRNIYSDGTTNTHTFIPPELSQDSRQHLYNSITTAGHHYSSYTPTHNLIKNTPFQASKQFDTTRHFRILENQHQKEYTDAKNEHAQYFSRFYLVSDSETGLPTSATTQPLSGLRHVNPSIPTQTTIAQNNIQIMRGNVFGHKHPFDPRIDIINKQKQSTLPSSLGSSLPQPPSSSSSSSTATSTANDFGRNINNHQSQQQSPVNRAVTWVSNLFGHKQHYSTYNHYIQYNRYYKQNQYQYTPSTRSFIPKSTIEPFQPKKSMISTSKYYFSSMSSSRHMQREAVIKPKPFSRHRYDIVQLQYNKSFLKRFHNVVKPIFEPTIKPMNNDHNNHQHSASRSYTNNVHYYNNNSSSSTALSQPKRTSSSSSSQSNSKRQFSTTITTMMRLFNSSRNNNSYNKSTGTFDEGCNFARQQQQIHKELQPSSSSTTTSSSPSMQPPGLHVSRDTLMNSTCGTPYSHRLKTPTSTSTASSTYNPVPSSTSTANNSATSTSTGSKSSMNTAQTSSSSSSSSSSHEQSRIKTQSVQNDIDESFQPPIQHPISTTVGDATSRLDPLHKQQKSH